MFRFISRVFFLSVFLIAAMALPALAQTGGCMRTMSGGFICPPPSGGMATDIRGKLVCGPGPCARNADGKVKCSSQPGGAIDLDNTGNVLCVGGCVDGDASYCVTPTR